MHKGLYSNSGYVGDGSAMASYDGDSEKRNTGTDQLPAEAAAAKSSMSRSKNNDDDVLNKNDKGDSENIRTTAVSTKTNTMKSKTPRKTSFTRTDENEPGFTVPQRQANNAEIGGRVAQRVQQWLMTTISGDETTKALLMELWLGSMLMMVLVIVIANVVFQNHWPSPSPSPTSSSRAVEERRIHLCILIFACGYAWLTLM